MYVLLYLRDKMLFDFLSTFGVLRLVLLLYLIRNT